MNNNDVSYAIKWLNPNSINANGYQYVMKVAEHIYFAYNNDNEHLPK